ncbi:unnamed protein product [Adineta steineri]|nr:unnamed protein product [Adineta steineri]
MASIDQRIFLITISATGRISIATGFQETIHIMMSDDDSTNSALPEFIQLVNGMITFYTIITDGQQIIQSSPTSRW